MAPKSNSLGNIAENYPMFIDMGCQTLYKRLGVRRADLLAQVLVPGQLHALEVHPHQQRAYAHAGVIVPVVGDDGDGVPAMSTWASTSTCPPSTRAASS